MRKLFLILALAAPLAHAAPIDFAPNAPIVYEDNLLRRQLPTLFTTDRAAFALYESLQQVGETYVQVNGCKSINGSIDTFVDQDGTGELTLTTPGSVLRLDVVKTEQNNFRGNKFQTTAASGRIAGTPLSAIEGNFTYNTPGTIMTGATDVTAFNDRFSSSVIKDFYRANLVSEDEVSRDYTVDWGVQAISKLGFPASKYWQRSISLHDDGIVGRTRFIKDRIAGGSKCRITLKSHGFDNNELFSQIGKFIIQPL